MQSRAADLVSGSSSSPSDAPVKIPNLYYPLCFRDSSEIRRPALAVPEASVPALRVDATPAVRRTTAPTVRRGVAMTGNRMFRGAAAVAVCVTVD